MIGSPKGLPSTISDGLVSSLRNFEGKKFIQITAPISSGSSGGPVLNSNGELVGISVGQLSGGQNLNFAIPITYLQKLLISERSKAESLTKLPVKTSTISSSKIETQDWIKEKIEGFTMSYNKPEYSSWGNNKYEVEFRDCNIIIKYIWTHNAPSLNGGRDEIAVDFIYTIPIKSLAKLNFIKHGSDYQILFKIKTNENLIESTSIDKSQSPEERKTKFENNISLYISEELLTNNLPERLTNAFNNLIELCGGKITKEVF